jgi:hypothetical protein
VELAILLVQQLKHLHLPVLQLTHVNLLILKEDSSMLVTMYNQLLQQIYISMTAKLQLTMVEYLCLQK